MATYNKMNTAFSDQRTLLLNHKQKGVGGRVKDNDENRWIDIMVENLNRLEEMVAEQLAQEHKVIDDIHEHMGGDLVAEVGMRVKAEEEAAGLEWERNKALEHCLRAEQSRDFYKALAEDAVATLEGLRKELDRLEKQIALLPHTKKEVPAEV
jgi:hypothetical protein